MSKQPGVHPMGWTKRQAFGGGAAALSAAALVSPPTAWALPAGGQAGDRQEGQEEEGLEPHVGQSLGAVHEGRGTLCRGCALPQACAAGS